MKKVKFTRHIPLQYEQTEHGKRRIEGTGCFEKGFQGEGIFHCWGTDYEEFEENAGNFTVAIVQLDNGRIEKVLPNHIQFI